MRHGHTSHVPHPKVNCAPGGTYLDAFAVLSSDLLLFVKRDTPSIELCHLTSHNLNPRGGSLSITDGLSTPKPDPTPSLRVMRRLALPTFKSACNIMLAGVYTDRHIEHRRKLEVFSQEQEQEQECIRPIRAPAPLPFHSAPEDRVLGITLFLGMEKVSITVSCRALFALAANGCPSADCQWGPDGGAADDTGGGGSEEETAKQKQEQVMVPWEEWGPQVARLFAPSPCRWIATHAGQRWFSLKSDKLVIHDFGAARVRQAHTRSHRAYVSADTCQDNNRQEAEAAAAENVIQSGPESCFKDDVISSLPFLETNVDIVPADGLLTDGEGLIVFIRSVSRSSSLPRNKNTVKHSIFMRWF
jgi:hypothetical protein